MPGPGNTLRFTGFSGFTAVNCGTATRGITSQVTVEAWIKTSSSSLQFAATKYSNSLGEDSGFQLGTNNGHAAFYGRARTGTYYVAGESSTVVADGRWHHIAGVCNDNVWQIYVDGVLENSATYPYSGGNLASSQVLSIGNYWSAGDYYFNGNIDEVRVWNTALTAAQIRANMCRKITIVTTAPTNLVAYYRLDQSSGNSVPDLGSQPVTGTVSGTTSWTTSGAPIGDLSVAAYPGSGTVSLTAASGDVATVSGLSGAQGVQLYAINSAPTSAPSSGAASTYFGVFSLPTTATYTFALQPQNSVSVTKNLYSRSGGDAASWSTTSPTRSATTLTLTGQSYRAEYIIADPNAWTGAVSTVYTNPANWSAGFVPTFTDNVVIPANAVRMPVLSGTASAASFGVETGASMTIDAAGTLTLFGGSLTNNGAFGGPGSLVLNPSGSAVQLSGTAGISVGSLNATGNGTTDVRVPLSISRVLTLNQNLALNGAGTLTLLSDAQGTAMVVNVGNGQVIGNATVQRYLDGSLNAGLGYRHLSAPVANTTMADLVTAAFSPVVNPAYNTVGNSVTPFPTVFGYDQSRVTSGSGVSDFDMGWVSPASLTEALVPGRGYTVNTTGNQTLDFVGTLGNGNVSLSGLTRGTGPQAGWHLLGNPYPAPMLWSRAYQNATGLDNAVYVYKSNGQYTGSFVNGVGANGGSDVIPMGQAFFVRTSAPGISGSLNLTNAARVTSYQNPLVQRPAAETRPLLRLQLRGSATATDEVVLYMQAGATTGFDGGFDAFKVSQGETLALGVPQGAEQLSISGLPLTDASTLTVPLTGRVPQPNTTYTLTAAELLNLPAGRSAYLHDGLTGSVTDLGQQPSYRFTSATTDLAGRFTVSFSASRVLAASQAQQAQIGLYPNPARRELFLQLPVTASPGVVGVTLVNALGQRIFGQTLAAARATGTQRVELPSLPAGVYTVRVALTSGVVTRQLVIE
ncbi:LamG-like jellyroll fold domain-containing protein [Hymenobacter sp. CRA2]|uniref:LamG-like jellyroll fold domain-containing protein n=1 Tax=Hymenobacter sp. CRA2 TaxID=1955620 RepID=UPI0015910739|nr:LamG-like jellyroll fold domain-containing protein [Hymenobacter sp. CRA2]